MNDPTAQPGAGPRRLARGPGALFPRVRPPFVAPRMAGVPLLGGAALFLGVLLLGGAREVAPEVLMKDPAAVTEVPPWVGLLSNLGILGWCAGAAISGFAAVLLPRAHPARAFLGVGAAVTAWLMLDDLFLLHESVLPTFTGVPQTLIYAGYAGALGLFVLRFRAQLWRGERELWALAVVLLAGSVAADVAFDRWPGLLEGSGGEVLEDLLKFLGILIWSLFFIRAGRQALEDRG